MWVAVNHEMSKIFSYRSSPVGRPRYSPYYGTRLVGAVREPCRDSRSRRHIIAVAVELALFCLETTDALAHQLCKKVAFSSALK